jgi:hypothetical protein
VEARSRLVYKAIQNLVVRAIADNEVSRLSAIFGKLLRRASARTSAPPMACGHAGAGVRTAGRKKKLTKQRREPALRGWPAIIAVTGLCTEAIKLVAPVVVFRRNGIRFTLHLTCALEH